MIANRFAAMLDLLEAELGEEIRIDRRLEALVDADPSAMDLHGARAVPP
jgi:hypothetical protein